MASKEHSSDIKKKIEHLEKKLVGQKVEIVDPKHPWCGNKGIISSVEHTLSGFGVKIELENGFTTCVFNGKQIKS